MTTALELAQVQSVRDLLVTLSKAQKDYKTYPRNNPVLKRRRQELLEKFSAILLRAPVLVLKIGSDEIRFEGSEVYRSSDRRESVAYQLYRHGIREIQFLQGLPENELDELIDAINTDLSSPDQDDDLITILWECDLRYVRYSALDDLPADVGWISDPAGIMEDVIGRPPEPTGSSKFADILQAERGIATHQDPRSFEGLALSREEIHALAAMVEEDKRRDTAFDVIGVLLEVLHAGVAPEEAGKLLQILKRAVELSIEQRKIKRAGAILKHFSTVAESTPAFAAALQQLILHFASKESVDRFIEALNDGTEYDPEDAYHYIAQLTSRATMPLVESFAKVEDRKLRKLLCIGVAELVKNEVEVLAKPVQKYLVLKTESGWFILRNVAHILGLTKNPESLKLLKQLCGHSHKRVRSEALRAAAQFRSQTSRDIVLRALKDPELEIRLVALDLTHSFGDHEVLNALTNLIRDKAFRDTDAIEQRAVAVAYGKASGDQAIPLLADLLTQRSRLGLKRASETNAAGAAGLAAIGTPAAVEVLRNVATELPHLSDVIQAAVNEARG